MSAEDTERPQEIIIVRRGGGDEDDGHHGGAWKIAFADFMTAMMCFFLVMWLINASNEETRAALASYFNPVKLIDRNTNRKGLEEIGQGPQSTSTNEEVEDGSAAPAGRNDKTSGPADFKNATEMSEVQKFSDQNFFANPYAVLAEIAADVGRDQNISAKGEGGAQLSGPSSGASGGEAYRDPFAPDFWSQQVAEPKIGVEGDPDNVRQQPSGADQRAIETGAFELAENGQVERIQGADSDKPDKPAPAPLHRDVAELQPLEPVAEPEPQPAKAQETQDTPQPEIQEAAARVRQELARALEGEGLAASVSVTAGQQGVQISVTDDLREAMFDIGSAVPQRTLVSAMEKIGRTLAAQGGSIRIHGHTDGRPFQAGDYDNWRLSTARAHAAQYMLVRGGVPEDRISEVAGFADRKLKLPDDPYADANRRIDIFLEVE